MVIIPTMWSWKQAEKDDRFKKFFSNLNKFQHQIFLPHAANFMPTSVVGMVGVNIPGVSYTNTGGSVPILIRFCTDLVIPALAPTWVAPPFEKV